MRMPEKTEKAQVKGAQPLVDKIEHIDDSSNDFHYLSRTYKLGCMVKLVNSKESETSWMELPSKLVAKTRSNAAEDYLGVLGKVGKSSIITVDSTNQSFTARVTVMAIVLGELVLDVD